MHYKIVVKHSRIEINNYEPGDAPQLEYTFSVYDPIYHRSTLKAIEYDTVNKKLILPRGIDLGYVKNIFFDEPMIDRNCDPFINTNPIPIKYLTNDERQAEILKFILGVEKYQYTRAKSQLCINSATGSGKTFVTVASICYSGARAIIITSSLNWLKQWRDRILEYTNLPDEAMYLISGSGSINKLLARNNIMNYQIFLVSHSTIRSYGDNNGWNKVDELFNKLNCSLKIYDEAHLYFDNICKIDYHSNTYKTLYLTATPARSDKDENLIYQLYFKNVPSISLFDENTDPHVNYLAIHFNSHPSYQDIARCKSQYGFNRINYTKYVVNRPNFLMLLDIIIDMTLYMPGKVLIYIGVNESIQTVHAYLCERFPFLRNYIGIYTSVIKDNKENQLMKKYILSTTKSCGAASDIFDLKVTVNLAEPFKSSVLAQQTLGRCRANDSLYIDIVDTGFFYTKRYYKVKQPIFSRYAKSTNSIVIDDMEWLS